MIILKSAILSMAFLVGNFSPAENFTVEADVEEYCYSITVTVNLPYVGDSSVTADACGETPQEGLEELGRRVRALAERFN